jgi:Flp pilus assembly protein TadG
MLLILRRAKARHQAWVERLIAERRAATAVEFALIATPFFILLMGLLEVAMMFMLSTNLDFGVAEAARRVRTGEIQNGGGQAAFRTLLCAEVSALMACDANLMLDVRTVTDFASMTNNNPISGGNVDPTQFIFDAGDAGDIVLVRAFYKWQIITPMLGTVMKNMNGNQRLVQANAAFRNEPFGD